MNATQHAVSAYGKKNTPLRTNRGIEFEVFARVTRRIKLYSQAEKTVYSELVSALHINRQLWTTLAINVADSENNLSAELRAQIFYLAEFTNNHTREILNGSGTPNILVEINTSVMRGLSQEGCET